jgi:hypothetical protein
MIIKFAPSGTHTHHGQLKIRLDLYPDIGDKSYSKNHILDNGVWKLNPCLVIFAGVDENITPDYLTQFIGDTLKSDVLTTIDNAMVQTNAAHLISPYMKRKTTMSRAKTGSFDEVGKAFIGNRLSNFSLSLKSGGVIELIQPRSVDVGPGAVDRAGTSDKGNTYIATQNPANEDGVLDVFEVWPTRTVTNLYMGTFYQTAPAYWTNRDYETLGALSFGSKQTITGMTCNVSTSDTIGWYDANTYLEQAGGGAGATLTNWAGGNIFGAGNSEYSSSAGVISSLYATGSDPIIPASGGVAVQCVVGGVI